ncbi:MAG TPA: hypothetical protein GYA04_02485, partial [Acholeplasma sp.]|nr:hypothetical protein [Acholeplasma sp.]
IINEEVVENIFNAINGFEFYLVDVPQAPMDSNIRAGDIITFTDGVNEYPTIAQYSMSYGGSWVGGYSLQLNTEKQQETQIINTEEKIKNIQTIVDRVNNQMQIVAEETSETSSKISLLEQNVDGFKIETTQSVNNVKNELAQLKLTAEELNLKFQKTGNNLFQGTHFRNLDNWRENFKRLYVESPTPPEDSSLYWFCTKESGIYQPYKMYEYDDVNEEWVLSNKTRLELDKITNPIIKIGSNANIKNKTISSGYLELSLDNTPQSVLELHQNIVQISPEQEKITTAFHTTSELSQGIFKVAIRFYENYPENENEFVYEYVCNLDQVTDSILTVIETNLESNFKYITLKLFTMTQSVYAHEDALIVFDKYTLWGNLLNNKIYKPTYDEDGEFVEWVVLEGVSMNEAIDNATNYPEYWDGLGSGFLFPKGTVNIWDLKSEYGDYSLWSPNPNELVGSDFVINDKGIFITSGESKLTLSADEIISVYRDTKIFEIYNDIVYGKKLYGDESNINGLVTKVIQTNGKKIYIRYIEGGD